MAFVERILVGEQCKDYNILLLPALLVLVYIGIHVYLNTFDDYRPIRRETFMHTAVLVLVVLILSLGRDTNILRSRGEVKLTSIC